MNFGSMNLGILRNGGILGGGGGPDITEFGDGIAIENTVQYFTSGYQEITHMNARNLTGQCLITRRLGSSTAPPFHLIDDAITQVWVMSGANLRTTAALSGGSYIDEARTYAYVTLGEGDGVTYPLGKLMAMRLNMSDGTQDWVSSPSATSGGDALGTMSRNFVDVDEANDRMFFEVSRGNHEIRQFTASTGAEIAVSATTFGDAGLPTGCLTPDKTKIVAIERGDECLTYMFNAPFTELSQPHIGAPGGYLNLGGSVSEDSVNDFGWAEWGDYGAHIVPARDGTNHVYICVGFRSTLTNNHFIGLMDPDGTAKITADFHSSNGAILAERDVNADSGIALTSYKYTVDIAVDRFGYVYALTANGNTTTAAWDIVRYKPDLTEPFSFVTDGGVTMPAMSTYGYVTRLAVDEAGSVFVGTRTGYVIRFSQT